ncbi:hypothetical protein BJV82DRAFT_671844 [Fennellomyces sp. T-0311]|nr:hypothetical protein BJV82DRAFT_671844 [Fennellomyces sp. T-0311]
MEPEIEHHIHNLIVQRMVAANQSHQHVDVASTSLMLPVNHRNEAEYRDLVAQIMNDHTRMDDGNTTVYYMRSWSIQPNTLRQILASWVENEAEYPETDAWTHFALHYRDEPLHVRYIGKVTGAAPISRHHADSARAGGILGNFLNTLRQVDPQAFGNTQIYEFSRMRTTGDAITRDTRERIAIAFFGVDSLLNIQHGGYYNAYDPGDEAFNTFAQRYHVAFFNQFSRYAARAVNGQNVWMDRLGPWVDEIAQVILNQDPNVPMPLGDTIMQQAIPRTVNGYTILVLIGYDITVSNYRYCRAFFDTSRSGNLTKDFLCRQEAWSRGQRRFDSALFDTSPFPFLDVYPWLNRTNTQDAAVHQVSRYMGIVRPIITVTFNG